MDPSQEVKRNTSQSPPKLKRLMQTNKQVDSTLDEETKKEINEFLLDTIKIGEEANENCVDHITHIDQHFQDAVDRRVAILTSKFNPRLDEAKKELANLKDQLKEMEKYNKSNKNVEELSKKLSEFRKMSESMRKKYSKLEKILEEEKERNVSLKKQIKQYKDTVQTINRRNLNLLHSYQEIADKQNTNNSQPFFITHYDAEGKLKKSLKNSSISSYSKNNLKLPLVNTDKLSSEEKQVVNNLQKEYESLLAIADQENMNQKIYMGSHAKKLKEIIELNEFFRSCFEAASKKFVKDQDILKSEDKSLSASLMSELHTKKQILKDPKNSVTVGMMQDRQQISVIYKTIKSIISTAKQKKKMEHIKSIKIDWESFKQFKPLHIIGLLMLRKDVLETIEKEAFTLPFSSVNLNAIEDEETLKK